MDDTAELVDEGWEIRGGSKLQTQIAVRYRRSDLEAAIRGAFPDLQGESEPFDWLAPLHDDSVHPFHEPVGPDLLDYLGLDLRSKYKGFWPLRRGAPTWDGLAWLHHPAAQPSVAILIEAKSYPGEFFASCKAKPLMANGKPNPAYSLIAKSIGETQTWLGLPAEPARWMFDTEPLKKGGTALYQTANRLAMLRFLQQHKVDARFVYLLFLDDPRSPTSADDWHKATGDARQRLRLERTPPGMAYVHFPAVQSPTQFILRQTPEPNDVPR